MFEALFGTEMPLALRFFIAFVIVLALIGASLACGIIQFNIGLKPAKRNGFRFEGDHSPGWAYDFGRKNGEHPQIAPHVHEYIPGLQRRKGAA